MILAEDGRPLALNWSYTRDELIADGVVHVVGVALGVLGAAALVAAVILDGVAAELRLAVLVYALGLVAMLGASTTARSSR
jgi:hemolysin III